MDFCKPPMVDYGGRLTACHERLTASQPKIQALAVVNLSSTTKINKDLIFSHYSNLKIAKHVAETTFDGCRQ